MRSKRRELRGQFLEVVRDIGKTPEEQVDCLLDIAFPEKSLTKQQAMVGVLARVMYMEVSLNAGRLVALASAILKAEATPEDIADIYDSDNPESPWRKHWRGKDGQPPGEKDIRDTLGVLRRVLHPKQDASVIEYK